MREQGLHAEAEVGALDQADALRHARQERIALLQVVVCRAPILVLDHDLAVVGGDHNHAQNVNQAAVLTGGGAKQPARDIGDEHRGHKRPGLGRGRRNQPQECDQA